MYAMQAQCTIYCTLTLEEIEFSYTVYDVLTCVEDRSSNGNADECSEGRSDHLTHSLQRELPH